MPLDKEAKRHMQTCQTEVKIKQQIHNEHPYHCFKKYL